ncbi:alpha/beta-hydrolase [Pseudovirgaria hyperparasitica]|uniref:Alpha/beta-hydrolase n=1 Tax=Pseudovirgaria hyperparasitica TaxID=470096 RepID=A0A6A6WDQ5_9PEZI|nr:alpha/beta-hydrolase [Pseudovirgaria hyperparasitica]KAF2760110.1 alpha/beta-hydrolase [Pseudovirgaria hyperparasitica]
MSRMPVNTAIMAPSAQTSTMYTTYSLIVSLLTVSSLCAPAPAATSCPDIHIFGARNTGTSQTGTQKGYGAAYPFVTDILNAYPGSTAEAIIYPANGTASLTDATYKASVRAGVANLTAQVKSFAGRCTATKLVLVGYSQGAKIIDDALCGGGDPNSGISDTAATIAQFNIKAVLLPGDDRFTPGESFHVGNATHGGFDARPADQVSCGKYDAAIQLYCDAEDEFCSNGTSLAVHNGYYKEFGSKALAFVKSRLG